MEKYVIAKGQSGILGFLKHITRIFCVIGILLLNNARAEVKLPLGKSNFINFYN